MAELIEARIETIAAGGAGLARVDGKTVFIKGGIQKWGYTNRFIGW